MRLGGLAFLASIMLAASATPAAAAVTIGQLPPGATTICSANDDQLNRQTGAGNSYQVPSTGGITSWTMTSWSTAANAATGQQLTMKVFHQNSATSFTAVLHDGPRPLTPSSVNTFPVSIPVRAADVLGLRTVVANGGCDFPGVTGDVRVFRFGDLADGQTGDFNPSANTLMNISAELSPTNTFSFGRTDRNKRRGTATLTVNVPNPGELTVSGKGVKAASAGADTASTHVTGAGSIRLRVKARGKQRSTLNQTGKVKLKAKVTFTPTGGEPLTRSTKVKLKKLG